MAAPCRLVNQKSILWGKWLLSGRGIYTEKATTVLSAIQTFNMPGLIPCYVNTGRTCKSFLDMNVFSCCLIAFS